jgi:hypothetical protein
MRDRAAFDSLYQQTSAKLFGVCLRVLKNQSEAARKLGVLYYLDVGGALFRNPDTLAICLDSLHVFTESYIYNSIGPPKLRQDPPFDLVILDESEQLFAHSIGGTLTGIAAWRDAARLLPLARPATRACFQPA